MTTRVPRQWKYARESFDFGTDVTERLDTLARVGWEVVNFTEVVIDKRSRTTAWLRRELP